MATGGVIRGPGSGTSDSIPAMLSNGEAVIPAKQVKKYSGFIQSMISGNVPGFAGGVMLPKNISKLGKTIKTRKEYDAPAEEANAGYLASSMAGKKPEPYLRQHSGSGGHSFAPFGVGGVYIKPNGTPVMVKPVQNEQLARAEMFGTQIARDAHGLKAPQQKLVVLQDPTDFTGQRKFLALESPYDKTFVPPEQQSFTKNQFFKQLVASLVRNDKDLQAGNLWGNVLADVGPAGVFAKASGIRSLTTDLPSMQQQAMINLLGVKGGARKDFALSTADMAKKISPKDYAAGITKEIDEVLPKLKSTINSFNLTKEEKVAYQAMVGRLEAGRGANWTEMQAVHAAALATAPKAKGFSEGGFVGGNNATVAFGAHQPFTTAHQMIAQMGMDRATAAQSQFLQFTTMQGKSKRSILTDEVKRKLISEALGIQPQFAKNPFDLMKALSEKGYKNVDLLLGEDRMSSNVWEKAAKEYGINLNKVGVPRPEGSPSGTAARAAAAAGNRAAFGKLLASGVSKRTSNSVFSALFNALSGGKKPAGYANGVVSVPGPKGKGDVVPAMLSPGEAVIPAAMAKKYGGLINGMVAGTIPGYSRGKGSDSNFGHFGPGSSISVQDALSSSDIRLTQAMRRNLEQVVSISKTAVMDLKHAWGAEMSGKTNRQLPSGANIADVQKEFSGKNITERYGESAKFAGVNINDTGLQKEIKAYDTAMQQ
jgi:hypothetical protein